LFGRQDAPKASAERRHAQNELDSDLDQIGLSFEISDLAQIPKKTYKNT
jgi:hypothetical protein